MGNRREKKDISVSVAGPLRYRHNSNINTNKHKLLVGELTECKIYKADGLGSTTPLSKSVDDPRDGQTALQDDSRLLAAAAIIYVRNRFSLYLRISLLFFLFL